MNVSMYIKLSITSVDLISSSILLSVTEFVVPMLSVSLSYFQLITTI